ncbi:hypothetical protein ISCGN_029175 [Ixodes scapularis]
MAADWQNCLHPVVWESVGDRHSRSLNITTLVATRGPKPVKYKVAAESSRRRPIGHRRQKRKVIVVIVGLVRSVNFGSYFVFAEPESTQQLLCELGQHHIDRRPPHRHRSQIDPGLRLGTCTASVFVRGSCPISASKVRLGPNSRVSTIRL